MAEVQENKIRKDDEDVVSQLWYKYLPYWPLFIVLLSGCLAAGWLYSKWVRPVYEIDASLLIKDEKEDWMYSKILESLNLFKGKKIVENEIEVLQSHNLARQVVLNLGLYAPVFEQHKSKNLPAYNYAPITVRAKSPDSIVMVEKVPFTYNQTSQQVVIGQKAYPLNQWVNTPWGELIFQSNFRFSESGHGSGSYFFALMDVDIMDEQVLRALKVAASNKLSSIIELSYRDVVPERGVKILNELIKVYLDAEVNERNLLASNTTAFVEERLRYVVGQLDSVESAIQRYRTTEGVINIGEQGKMYLDNVGQYDKKAQEISVQLEVLDQLESFVSSKNAITGIVPSSLGVSDPVLTQLLDKLNEAQLTYERLKKTTAENSPMMVSLNDQIAKLKPSIMENIRTQRSSLETNRINLTNNSNRFSSMLSTIPQKERQLVEISRQQAIKNQIYSFLLQKREEAALSKVSAGEGDARVVNQAYASSSPVSPNINIIYLAAAMSGFGLALLLVLAKENLGGVLYFRKEMENMIPLPILAELTQDRTKAAFVLADGQKSAIAEQIRSLRNGLLYSEDKNPLKKILVTSSIKGEGKSFISSNLALSISMTGKKTLIIDMDLSRSKLTGIFQLEGRPGIANFLAGKAQPASILYKTNLNDKLFFVPAGAEGATSTELIVGGKVG